MNATDRIRTFIRETFFVDQVNDRESFLETGLIDSTGMIELVAFVQQTFGIRVEDSELIPENLDSLSRLVEFIERKRATANAE
jgi:acyl carrier protein